MSKTTNDSAIESDNNTLESDNIAKPESDSIVKSDNNDKSDSNSIKYLKLPSNLTTLYKVDSIGVDQDFTFTIKRRECRSDNNVELVWKYDSTQTKAFTLRHFVSTCQNAKMEQGLILVIWEQIEKELNLDTKLGSKDNYPDELCTQLKHDSQFRGNNLALIDGIDDMEHQVFCPVCGIVQKFNALKVHLSEHAGYFQRYRIRDWTFDSHYLLPAEIIDPSQLNHVNNVIINSNVVTTAEFRNGKTGVPFGGIVQSCSELRKAVLRAYLVCERCLQYGVKSGGNGLYMEFFPSKSAEDAHLFIPLLEKCPWCHREGHLKIHTRLVTVFDFVVGSKDGVRIKVRNCHDPRIKKGDLVVVDARVLGGKAICKRVQILKRHLGKDPLLDNLEGYASVEIRIKDLFVEICINNPNKAIYLYDGLRKIYNNGDHEIKNAEMFKEDDEGNNILATRGNWQQRKFSWLLKDFETDEGTFKRIGKNTSPLRYIWKPKEQ